MSSLHFAPLRTALAAATLAFSAAAAMAAPGDYSFAGSIGFSESPALDGKTFAGSFSLTLPLQDTFTGYVSLNSFQFSFGGQTYTLGTTDPGSTPSVYFENGQFSALEYASTGASLHLYSGFPDALQGTLDYSDAAGKFSSGAFQISAVPEPESYALMLGGLGLVGWLARRRQAV